MRVPLSAVVAIALLASCSKDENKSAPPAVTTSQPAPAPPPPAAPVASATASSSNAPAAQRVEIEIGSVGETMAFDKTKLTVPTGALVHLVLKNNGATLAMTHNWVLVKVGSEARVALAALQTGPDAGYIASGPDVLATTTMAAPKATTEVTFTAPAPGKYPYICTFPGHYMLMKGELTVTP